MLLVVELWLRIYCWEFIVRNNWWILWDFFFYNYFKENLCVMFGLGDSKNDLNVVLLIFKMIYNEMCIVFLECWRWDWDVF